MRGSLSSSSVWFSENFEWNELVQNLNNRVFGLSPLSLLFLRMEKRNKTHQNIENEKQPRQKYDDKKSIFADEKTSSEFRSTSFDSELCEIRYSETFEGEILERGQ